MKKRTYPRLYNIWMSIRRRCNNKNQQSYKYYGARGIRVCSEWDDYSKFKEWSYAHGYFDSGTRYNCTLDRIDNDGNYEPSNCRWTTSLIQSVNRRSRNNKSGYKGIYLSPYGKYIANIGINHDTIYLGTFANIEDAIKARQDAELKYYGFLFDGEALACKGH